MVYLIKAGLATIIPAYKCLCFRNDSILKLANWNKKDNFRLEDLVEKIFSKKT